MPEQEAIPRVEVVPYDPAWPTHFQQERRAIERIAGPELLSLEHIGSTSVPGLAAKPIVDMMAAAPDIGRAGQAAHRLETIGYTLFETGMADRLVLRRPGRQTSFQLHIVEESTWGDRHERLMRDYLLAHRDAALAYGELKARLAQQHSEDSLAYTRAKTQFIQGIVDKATANLGRPQINVWPE